MWWLCAASSCRICMFPMRSACSSPFRAGKRADASALTQPRQPGQPWFGTGIAGWPAHVEWP